MSDEGCLAESELTGPCETRHAEPKLPWVTVCPVFCDLKVWDKILQWVLQIKSSMQILNSKMKCSSSCVLAAVVCLCAPVSLRRRGIQIIGNTLLQKMKRAMARKTNNLSSKTAVESLLNSRAGLGSSCLKENISNWNISYGWKK